jgi:hypothetical protein
LHFGKKRSVGFPCLYFIIISFHLFLWVICDGMTETDGKYYKQRREKMLRRISKAGPPEINYY